jgi:5S rRNA maturation endonuclease (ribonuclease M5)
MLLISLKGKKMKSLTNHTLEELHNLNRDELIVLLVDHDKDGEYADAHRQALGEEPLNHQEALELCVNQAFE